MSGTILLLGHTGKMGTALQRALAGDYTVIGRNSRDFDATDQDQVRRMVGECAPDIVVNCVAMLGIDPCEQDPARAFALNGLYPRLLAQLSAERGFTLVHFSTDAVFSDSTGRRCLESDTPSPLNVYGMTKYCGDCFVMNGAPRHYIFRVPVLFGPSSNNTQFVEKMLQRVEQGATLIRVSDDIVSSPTLSLDAAFRVKTLLAEGAEFGLYHLANDGAVSLYRFMREVAARLGLAVTVQPASYRDFPFIGRKNLYTPLGSEKTGLLRPWQDAVQEYCEILRAGGR